MRIGIEAQRIFRKNKHGMDYVVLQEIKELQKMDTKNEYFVFVAPGEDVCLRDTKNFHIIEIGGNFYPIWEQVTLPKAVISSSSNPETRTTNRSIRTWAGSIEG